jgi:uncharacterized protein involved in exopolysaccharide biosynthesis/Mrp family chromosome partitioning ATPase
LRSLLDTELFDAPMDNSAARWQEQRVHSFFSATRRRWKLVAGAVILALGAAAASLHYMRPHYTSTALVQLDPQKKYANFDSVVGGLKEGDPIAIRTEVQVIREAIGGRVVDSLHLTTDSEFNPRLERTELARLIHDHLPSTLMNVMETLRATQPISVQNERAVTIRQVLRRLDLDSDGRSYIISISFTASNPERAAQIANSFALEYLQNQIDSKSEITAKANEWAESQLDNARAQVRDAEAAVERFRANNEAITEVGQGNVTAAAQQLNQINSQLVAAASARAAAEARLASAQRLPEGHAVNAIPEVLASTLIQQLQVQEASLLVRRADLDIRYGDKHPAIHIIDSEISHLEGKITEEVGKIIASIATETRAARAREAELASQMQALRHSVSDSSRLQSQLHDLERQADARRAFFATMEQRYVETAALLSGQYADAHIVAAASPQPVPSSPNVPLMFAVALAAAMALGGSLVAYLEYIDKGFRTPKDLETATRLACFGILPELGRAFRVETSSGELSGRGSPAFREAVKTIRVAIRLTDLRAKKGSNKGRVILVTSSLPLEGKTMSAVALARALASGGSRTLLIEADLRRPQVARYLGGDDSHDLATILENGLGPAAATRVTATLCVISGRENIDGAQELFLSPHMQCFMDQAKAEFDAVVIDSPPVMVVADAVVLARFSDVVLHVVRWGSTARTTVLAAIGRVRRVQHDAVQATILSRVDLLRYGRYMDEGNWSFRYKDYYLRSSATDRKSIR